MVGGTPSSLGGGGYPIQLWWGVPHPVMVAGGHPQYLPPSRPGWGGYPGYTPTIQTWPGGTLPPSRPGMGYPLPPTIQTSDGVPPYLDLRWGTLPPHLDLGQGTPPPHKCGQSENITSRHPSDAGGNGIVIPNQVPS